MAFKSLKILLLGLLVFLSACTSGDQAVNQTGPAANVSGSKPGVALVLPNPTASAAPTRTATPVVSYSPTGTKTPTPTWVPTKTATATSSPTRVVTVTPAAQSTIQHVVIITIDGLRPDALEAADTPNLDALRQAGAFTASAQAVLPSVTLVNHASILGGMSPEKHGVDWNVDDPSRGVINGPTLFSVAHDAGLSTAMVVGKPKFRHLVIPNSVDQYVYAGFLDVQVANKAIEMINADLPIVMFIHLPDVDSAGHLTGWMSPGQLLAVSGADGQVGHIVAALDKDGYLDSTLLILTSDHGGSGTSHGSDSPEDTTVPWLAVGPGVAAGKTLSTAIVAYDTAATALFALNLPIPKKWDGRPVQEIFE